MAKSKNQTDQVAQISYLELTSIVPNDHNPRKTFPEDQMNDLMESILEKGILQPIIVRPEGNGFQIVAGERRYRAALAIMKNNPERVYIPAIVRNLADNEVKEIQIIENIQRAEMHPMEEAEAFIELTKNNNIPEEIAAKVGKSVYYVRQRLKLTDLRHLWPEAYKAGHLKHKDALLLSTLPADIQVDIFNIHYKKKPFALEPLLLSRYQCNLNSANFKLDVQYGELEKCTNCQFNTGRTSLFPEDESNARCTNRRCYELKVNMALNQDISEAKQDPGTVLITSDPTPDKKKKEGWTKEGMDVYSNKDFEALEEPDIQDYDIEDEDDGDDEKNRYENDLLEYEEKLKDPTLVKALVVDGYHQGSTIQGFITNNRLQKEATADKNEDIKNEISRIKDREARNKQLDNEKVWNKITELIDPKNNKKVLFNLLPLNQEELNAAGHVIQQEIGWQNRDWINSFNKWWGCGKNVTEEQLYGLLRMLIVKSLVHIGVPHTTKGSGAAYAYPILKGYFPAEVQAIEVSQKEIADQRAEKVNQKLKALNKKLEKAKAKA